jgi:hypothetical protein
MMTLSKAVGELVAAPEAASVSVHQEKDFAAVTFAEPHILQTRPSLSCMRVVYCT